MREEKGIIKEYIDDINGIILGEDNIEYFFSKVNMDSDITGSVNEKVIFIVKEIKTEQGYVIHKAVDIVKLYE